MSVKSYQSKYKRVGQPYDRKDARDKVTGQAIYTYDLEMPGMLHARVLLSPYARAKIVSIDTSKAKALPGVRAVLTGEDSDILVGLTCKTNVLSRGETRYHGDVVAAVAAETEEIAERAISLLKLFWNLLNRFTM